MEHGGDPERGAEPPGIAPECQQGLGRGSEQECEEASAVVQHQSPERGRQGEDDVEVRGREKARHPRVDPAGGEQGLALGAVAVAAGLVGGPGVAAGGAHVEMPAEQGGAAGRDGALVEGERVLASIGGPVGADDIGDVGRATLRSLCQTALREIGCPGLVPWKR